MSSQDAVDIFRFVVFYRIQQNYMIARNFTVLLGFNEIQHSEPCIVDFLLLNQVPKVFAFSIGKPYAMHFTVQGVEVCCIYRLLADENLLFTYVVLEFFNYKRIRGAGNKIHDHLAFNIDTQMNHLVNVIEVQKTGRNSFVGDDIKKSQIA